MDSYVVGLIGLFIFLLIFFLIRRGRNERWTLRSIRAFTELQRNIELSVEDGSRMQVSLGRGGLLGPQAAAGLAGLTLLRQVAETASDSDLPPIATSGEGVLGLLSQDTLRSTYKRLGISESYSNSLGQVSGLTPFSYAAGTMPPILDKYVSASAMVGSFGAEAGLITAASQKHSSFTLAGSDSLSTQALLYAAAGQPLIGEELYASGAYLDAGAAHTASLQAQDVIRWLVITIIFFSAFGKLINIWIF